MPRRNPEPYFRNPFTGESATEEHLEIFFDQYSSPGERTPSIYDTIFGLVPVPVVPLYKNGSKQVGKSYVGRAGHSSSSKNPHELLWCLKIDIASACRTLPDLNRLILGLRYIREWSDETIAGYLQPTYPQLDSLDVYRMVRASFKHLATILDR